MRKQTELALPSYRTAEVGGWDQENEGFTMDEPASGRGLHPRRLDMVGTHRMSNLKTPAASLQPLPAPFFALQTEVIP